MFLVIDIVRGNPAPESRPVNVVKTITSLLRGFHGFSGVAISQAYSRTYDRAEILCHEQSLALPLLSEAVTDYRVDSGVIQNQGSFFFPDIRCTSFHKEMSQARVIEIPSQHQHTECFFFYLTFQLSHLGSTACTSPDDSAQSAPLLQLACAYIVLWRQTDFVFAIVTAASPHFPVISV